MANGVSGALAAIRQPEYTGENRCMPCTVVNLLIAGTLTAVVGYLWLPLAPTALVLSLALIYVRGYLVPGTPTLTKRYLPERVLALFGKEPVLSAGRSAEAGLAESAQTLAAHGVIRECEDVDDLCLSDEFRDAWHAHMAKMDDRDQWLGYATVLADADPESVKLDHSSEYDRISLLTDGFVLGTWDEAAPFVADVTAAAVLSEWDPDWAERDLVARAEMATALRLFLERCPTCGGDVAASQGTVESCCATHEAAIVECVECGATLLRERLEDPAEQ